MQVVDATGCRLCHRINSFLAKCRDSEHSVIELTSIPRSFFAEDLPTSQLRDIGCVAHDPLVTWALLSFREAFKADVARGWTRMDQDHYNPWYLCVSNESHREKNSVPIIGLWDYQERQSPYVREMILHAADETQQPEPQLRALDRDWVNLPVAKSWIDECILRHASSCGNPLRVQRVSPAWLIDTEEECLVQGENDMEYVALSYRWGPKDKFQMNVDTLEGAKRYGGVSILRDSGIISSTVKDAMGVVKALGERYLWADAICLVHPAPPGPEVRSPKENQDAKVHLEQQVQLMGCIYAAAKFTIVATDCDNQSGILGIQGTSESRSLENIFDWEGSTITLRNLPILSSRFGVPSSYFHRGWTYQEYLLSPRRLIFGNKQVHWSCSCATWHEDAPHSDQAVESRGSLLFSDIPSTLKGVANAGELNSLLQEYHSRQFTYQADALPGISGLLTILTRGYKGGFLFGLPEAMFDAALMWHCYFPNVPIGHEPLTVAQRRISFGPIDAGFPRSNLPSWSWVGWTSNRLELLTDEEDYELPRTLIEGYKRRGTFITTPITQWFTKEKPGSLSKRRIESCWLQKSESDGIEGYGGQGWISESYDDSKHAPRSEDGESDRRIHPGIPWGVSGEHVFRHHLLPERYFWRPFPIETGNEDIMLRNPKQQQYLTCQTKRGWFRAVARRRGDEEYLAVGHWTGHVEIIGEDGVHCGWLQLPSREEAESFYDEHQRSTSNSESSTSDSEISNQPRLEIASVCLRRNANTAHFSQYGDMEGDRIKYDEYYGVLWIEWVKGIAFRKACGYVDRKKWETHELEDIELVLG